jgi:SAM-dependent methyltransferase
MWDERYSGEEYAYGTAPNAFLEQNFNRIPKGRVLSLAEGEGRNAVFLAKQGYSVTAVDGSIVGLNKARKLAERTESLLKQFKPILPITIWAKIDGTESSLYSSLCRLH